MYIYSTEKIIEQQTKAWRLKCCFRTIDAQWGRKKVFVGEREKAQDWL